MKGFIVAGTHSGVGKTTIAIGLMAALRRRGMAVQPFKAGPDYIDPSFHRIVCRRPSYNLDTWMMGVDGVKKTFAKAMKSKLSLSPSGRGKGEGDAFGIIEGVMGLFDGKDGRDEEGSTAHIAKVLKLPVIIVVDASAMARSAGALVYGYEKFDPKVRLKGVIFNKVGSERHFKMLKEAVEAKCKAKVLGYIPRDKEISLPERHLGLVMAGNKVASGQWSVVSKRLVNLIEKSVDVDWLIRLLRLQLAMTDKKARSDKGVIARVLARSNLNLKFTIRNPQSAFVRIAVAMDNAFCFYYQENLDILKEFGAELVFFSPLKDKRLPEDISGIYLGGGYPELYAKRLSKNKSLMREIKDLSDKGLPIYAECGGLMYLGKGLKDLKGRYYDMTGLFPYVSKISQKRMTLEYRELKAVDGCPFLRKGEKIRGHEFHYSNIDEPPRSIRRVYQVTGRWPLATEKEGYLCKNTLASYIHLHFASNPMFAKDFVRKCKENLYVNSN
jgi:cobyrinic acid a,c-diamide synthase